MSEPQEVLVRREQAGGVATITLDSPHNRNALFVPAAGAARRRPVVGAGRARRTGVVLTGTGPVFCAGADLKEQRGAGAPVTASFPDIMLRIWESPKPVVCRLNGTARAGGLGLVAACDFAVAPATASFAFTEVRLGVVPAMIAVTCLRRLEPRAAAEYFLTGEVFTAERAVEIGLLTRAVPEEASTRPWRTTPACCCAAAPRRCRSPSGSCGRCRCCRSRRRSARWPRCRPSASPPRRGRRASGPSRRNARRLGSRRGPGRGPRSQERRAMTAGADGRDRCGSPTAAASTATGSRPRGRWSRAGPIDVLTGDWLAELTMLILAGTG